jgi:hypothetical protein
MKLKIESLPEAFPEKSADFTQWILGRMMSFQGRWREQRFQINDRSLEVVAKTSQTFFVTVQQEK